MTKIEFVAHDGMPYTLTIAEGNPPVITNIEDVGNRPVRGLSFHLISFEYWKLRADAMKESVDG